MGDLYLATTALVCALSLYLVGCAPSDKPNFDEWYEEVINEPYNPTGLDNDN